MKIFSRPLATFLAVFATGAYAGGPFSICNDAAKTPVKYSGAGVVNLNYDLGTLGNRSKAQADAIVVASVALWTNVGTSSVTLGRGPDLPVDVTTANLATYNSTSDGLNPVIYDTDGSIIDFFFGDGAKNSTVGFAGSSFFLSPTCRYTEGRAVVSGFLNNSDTTLSIVIAHEIGHLIGMDHSQLNAIQGIALSGNRPLMYPIASRNTMTLHEDDEAAVSALYPDASLNTVYGEISGNFVLADGITPVKGANLWATETSTNKVYSIVSDFREQNTGFFRLLLPAGTYNLRAGTISTSFTGGSGVGPYSANATDLSFQPPLYNAGVAMPNVTLGNGVPTVFNMIAGCTATLTFRIDGTGTIGGNCSGNGVLLTVGRAGTGVGTVTSNPAGINCGGTCSNIFSSGSMVALTAVPDANSTFTGWSGGGCSGTGICNVSMSSAQSVTATFTALPEPFPTNCVVPAGWTTPPAAFAGWSVATDRKRTGTCSLKSNPMPSTGVDGNFNRAQIQITGAYDAGTISFYYNVSSEASFDCLRFMVDGNPRAELGSCAGNGGSGASGNISTWTLVSIPITAGPHIFTWSYEKDFTIEDGADAAWIDDVVLPPIAMPGVLQLSSATLTVPENIGTANLFVTRTGGTSGAVSVNYASGSGTAISGTDFTNSSGTLNWASGDGSSKPIAIPISNDLLPEGSETFNVAISGPVGATLGTPTTTIVTITDNDFVPDPPVIGAGDAGNGQAIINFTAPASDGGSPITGYTATCNVGGFTGTAAMSPIRKPTLVAALVVPLTPVNVTRARRLSVTPVSVTRTSLPEKAAVAWPNGVMPSEASKAGVPADVTGPLKVNTIRCPLLLVRGSTVTAPAIGVLLLSVRLYVPAAPCTLREATLSSATGAVDKGVTLTVPEAMLVPMALVAVTLQE